MISKNLLGDSSTTSCHWEVAIPYEMSSFFCRLKSCCHIFCNKLCNTCVFQHFKNLTFSPRKVCAGNLEQETLLAFAPISANKFEFQGGNLIFSSFLLFL